MVGRVHVVLTSTACKDFGDSLSPEKVLGCIRRRFDGGLAHLFGGLLLSDLATRFQFSLQQ